MCRSPSASKAAALYILTHRVLEATSQCQDPPVSASAMDRCLKLLLELPAKGVPTFCQVHAVGLDLPLGLRALQSSVCPL